MKKSILLIAFALVPFLLTGIVSAETADFEDLELQAESAWNGSDGSGGFTSNGATFSNTYEYIEEFEWEYWDGFAYSNKTDTEISGVEAQYNAITGAGVNGSEIYGIGYINSSAETPPTVTFDQEQVVSGAYFTNTNWAYYAMKNGDQFANKFEEGDWFKLLITGVDADGNKTGTVEVLLAEGTEIVDTWEWHDLSELGTVKKLTFSIDSTDKGEDGINTPTYFAMDNLNETTNDDDDSTCFIKTATTIESIAW